MINILCACEESQTVLKAFKKYSDVNIYSCDLQECSGGLPGSHIVGDCITLLGGGEFITQDGQKHFISNWDCLLAFPPCTYLSCAGAVNLLDKNHNIIDYKRYNNGVKAALFFNKLLNADIPFVCVENPRPIGLFNLPRPNQYVSPHFFGSDYSKRTYFWLKQLPPLMYTNICINPSTCTKSRWFTNGNNKYNNYRQKNRSKFFPEVAEAMATQWIEVLREGVKGNV